MFHIPHFNLNANVWRFLDGLVTSPPLPPPDFTTVCNLQFGRKFADGYGGEMWLLVPALTDIREYNLSGGGTALDVVEVPAGSGRFYIISSIDDVGKGFANEYRVGIMEKAMYFWSPIAAWDWPIPIP